MKKVRIIIKSLVEAGANGSFRLNDKYWLSSIDFSQLCRSLDLDPELTNTNVLINAVVTVHIVNVPKAGLIVKNPITGKDVTFKAHESEQPIERLFAWKLEDFNVSESSVNLQRITMLQGKSRTIGTGSSRASQAQDTELEEITQPEVQPAVVEEQPVVAAAPAEEELP